MIQHVKDHLNGVTVAWRSTNDLRWWCTKYDRPVLQQKWEELHITEAHGAQTTCRTEWRDVPMVSEGL